MVKVQNHERSPTYNFPKKGGKPGETVSVAPGETADIDVDPDDPQFVAATTFGMLTVVSGAATQKEPKAQNAVPAADKGTAP